jgi:putative transposase
MKSVGNRQIKNTTLKGLNKAMSTYTQIIYQIVFSTRNRENTLTKDNRPRLFEYIVGIIQKNKCHVYRINGVEDHIHIAMHLHPATALALLIKDIKIASSVYIKEKRLFKNFNGWQDGYGVFTYSYRDKDNVIEYVKNQEEHHRKVISKDEYIALLKENGVAYDERYLI